MAYTNCELTVRTMATKRKCKFISRLIIARKDDA